MEQTPSTTQPAEQQQQPPATSAAATPPQPPSTTATISSSSALAPSLPPTTASAPNPNPTSSLKPPTTTQSQTATSQTRPSFNTRPWQSTSSNYSHFSLPPPPLPSSSTPTSSGSLPPAQRGGMAIGVPAQHPATSPAPPTSFSSLTPPSYGQQSQARQPIQGTQGIGMTGSLGTTSAMRLGGITSHVRPGQSLRPQTSSSTQSPTTPNFQGPSMLRVPSLGSPGVPSPGSSHTQNQPWLSSGTQGKPPLPGSSLRPIASSQSLQQRSQISQQHQPGLSTSQQQQTTSIQQPSQPSTPGQSQEHFGQQFPPSRMQQPLSHQQQIARSQGLGTQRPSLPVLQTTTIQPLSSNKVTTDTGECSTRIVSKRSIQELVSQIDPSEKLDPEVEDILTDIAEDFVESITTFGCSLAKHRKSTTLEAKDILLNLERNWNMALPGYGGDEIRTYKKPVSSDIHRERLAAVKRSMSATETAVKNSAGPQGGNPKAHQSKGPGGIIGSPPNAKIREAG